MCAALCGISGVVAGWCALEQGGTADVNAACVSAGYTVCGARQSGHCMRARADARARIREIQEARAEKAIAEMIAEHTARLRALQEW